MIKRIAAFAAAMLLAGAAHAFDLQGTLGAAGINGGNVAGSSAQSGIVGGTALAGASTGTVLNQSTSLAGTQSQVVLGSNGMVGSVINQHQNTSVSQINSASLGGAFNVGGASGNAGSVGAGNFSGGFLGLNVHVNP